MVKKLLGIKGASYSYKYKVAICCIVKDESDYLFEWFDYHISIGVEHFFMYDNESKISLTRLLNEYIKPGIISVEVVKGKGLQMAVYQQCLLNNGTKCKWLAFIDADEFIVPKTLTGNLPDFLKAYKKFGGLGINWLVFGSNGHQYKQTSQVYSYTKRTLKTHVQNEHIKSIVQPRFVKPVKSSSPHHFLYRQGKYCVNENFEKIRGPRKTHSSNKIQLNHYNLRSLEDYQEKVYKGRADAVTDREMQYFYDVDKDGNLITDETIIELIAIMARNDFAQQADNEKRLPD